MVDVRTLYMEVMAFLCRSGGAYRSIDPATYHDVIDSLLNKQHRLTRDDKGNIASFTSWWMIHDHDLETVKNGGRPEDISGGVIFYIADHAGDGAISGLVKHLRATFGNLDCCFHHKFKQPTQFRYRRKTEAHIA